MDLARLKLLLIQQIIATDDPAVLENIRKILDEAEGIMVAEGEAPYFKLDDRMYSADEVRAILDEVVSQLQDDMPTILSKEEWADLDADHAAYVRGEGRNYTWDEVKEQLRKDRET